MRIKALFVDDDKTLRSQYREIIRIAVEGSCGVELEFDDCDRIEDAIQRLPRGQDTYALVFVDLLWDAIGGGGKAARGLDVVRQAAKTAGVTIVAFSVGDTKDFPELPEDAREAGADVFRIRGALQAAARTGAWDRLAEEICKALQANGALAAVSEEAEPAADAAPAVSRRAIFVVVGRHQKLVDSLFKFLRAVRLEPFEWETLVSSAISMGVSGGNPNVFDVVEHGFSIAQGAVVLFSPDDEAQLMAEHRNASDDDFESRLVPQPRPNVLLEAGYALRHDRAHTIIVSAGKLRPVSDLGGMHILRLDNSAATRKILADRLLAMGFDVDTTGKDWLTAGDFEI